MKKNLLILSSAILAGLGIYFAISIILPDSFVPEKFMEARIKGAELAYNIAELSNSSLKTLEQIEEKDRQGKNSEALDLASQELLKTLETRQQAIKLSSQLEKMARSLQDIKPAQARVLATEAVSSEVALVSRLLSYNDYLGQLFETLRAKFQSNEDTNGKVQKLLNDINDEAKAINDLNKKFTDSLEEFDKMF